MKCDLIDQLRQDLDSADYWAEAVMNELGVAADAARQRGVFAPALRVLAERAATAGEHSSLSTLIEVFLLGQAVELARLDHAFPKLTVAGAVELGLLTETDSETVDSAHPRRLRAALSLNPVQVEDSRSDDPRDWRIISDLDDQLRRGPARSDHVMGIGGATRSLISQAPSGDVASALDLGTGCGIVAMHLALRGPVVATDISARALMIARANARLNEIENIEFRQGDLFEPVAGECFELVLSNPPFVITPRDETAPIYEYRDGGMTGDALAERVVRESPAHLMPGGTLICLANWESPWGMNGLGRVQTWIEGAHASHGALAAWVIERDRVEPAQYAETWARDGGARPGSAEFEQLMAGWLDDFARRRIAAIGLGSIRIRRELPPARELIVHVEQVAGPYGGPRTGELLASAFANGVLAERMTDTEVLAAHWLCSRDVVEEREHTPGQESPRALALAIDRPLARRVSADPLIAAAVGACDGDLSLAQIADALATILEVDADAAAEALVAAARELAWLGMLAPSNEG